MANLLRSMFLIFCVCLGYMFVFAAGQIHRIGCSSVIPVHSINSAYLTINTKGVHETIILQMVSKECHSCPLQNVTYMDANKTSCTILVDTRWPSRLAVISDRNKRFVNCSQPLLDTFFHENGNYSIYVMSKNNVTSCTRTLLLNTPTDSNIPIYIGLGIFATLALIWIAFNKIRKSPYTYRLLFAAFTAASCNLVEPATITEQDFGTPTNATIETLHKSKTTRKERLKSLDAVRGLSLVIMMFVNYSGGGYWFFQHSKWNGLTVADLVFPWFIWIMGTAMAYSFKSLNMRSQSRAMIFWKIVKRSCILFLLGLLINSSHSENPFDFKKMRIMGVLQRFSLTYLVTATVHMLCTKPTGALQYTWWSGVRDIVDYWPEWLFNLMLITIYLFLTFLLPVPDCPRGYLGPGGIANDADGRNVTFCTGGAGGYIDRKVFGFNHIYQSPTCKELYYTNMPYEPEGLLGTITSCFLCFLGLQAGKILLIFKDFKARVRRFLVWAFVLGSFAAILCKCSQNDGWIPVNKNLWSLSFILTMACMAFLLLSFCYLTIDVYRIWSGSPFYYPGMNSIVVYMLHEFFSRPFQTFWAIEPKSHAVALTINLWDVTIWVLLSYYLYRKHIFLSI